MTHPVIRPATGDDLEGLLDLLAAVASEGRWIGAEAPIDRAERTGRLTARYLESDSACMFVAGVGGGVVGSCGVTDNRGLVDLGMMVAQGARRRGIGSALLEAAIEWARARSARKITLQVWPHNTAAIVLYERFGFEHEGYLKKHYLRANGEAWDAVVMGLLL